VDPERISNKENAMPKYVIERELPGAGQLSSEELHAISVKSNEVLAGMSGRATWQQSYVTDDKIYCVYIADDERAVREHAELSGFPADRVNPVAAVLDPASAEG